MSPAGWLAAGVLVLVAAAAGVVVGAVLLWAVLEVTFAPVV